MANDYNKKRAEVQEILARESNPEGSLLANFCHRFCAPPFTTQLGAVPIWIQIWRELGANQRKALLDIPAPCLNHIESRARKPERARHLSVGLQRLIQHPTKLFVEGLRLYPHVLCRTAETIGPLNESKWAEVERRVVEHRLWDVSEELTEEEFWATAEFLEDLRELPQPVLDFLAQARPKEEAPLEDFKLSLQRYLLRKRLEKIRHSTHELLRGERESRVIKVVS